MKIALLGYGTVGRGVDAIVSGHALGIDVARILELPDRLSDERMTASYDDIVNDQEIEAVVECMGGIEPARGFILRALAAGKSVVTSNKAVVAAHLEEFAREAERSGAGLLIEATCGGGVPWISSIERARRIDQVDALSGIMNGTTNYIVDAMAREGAEFGEVLARAQELGYAERDPSADIDGIDVRNKTIIAASVAFQTACTPNLPTTGIANLTRADLGLLAAHGLALRLLGRAARREGGYAASVEPVALPLESLEANVPGNFNLLTLSGATVGELKFYGQGAGMLPTGNAMVQDLIDCKAGRRPTYDLSGGLAYEPALLTSDYLFRTEAELAGAEPFAAGAKVVRGLTAEAAHALLAEALRVDETSFMAALAREV